MRSDGFAVRDKSTCSCTAGWLLRIDDRNFFAGNWGTHRKFDMWIIKNWNTALLMQKSIFFLAIINNKTKVHQMKTWRSIINIDIKTQRITVVLIADKAAALCLQLQLASDSLKFPANFCTGKTLWIFVCVGAFPKQTFVLYTWLWKRIKEAGLTEVASNTKKQQKLPELRKDRDANNDWNNCKS